jgi:hypothetical protein
MQRTNGLPADLINFHKQHDAFPNHSPVLQTLTTASLWYIAVVSPLDLCYLSLITNGQLALAVDSLLRSFIIEHSQILRNRLGKEPFAALLWTARLPARIGSTGHSALGTSLLLERDSPDSPEAAFASVAMDAYLKAQNGNHLHAGG